MTYKRFMDYVDADELPKNTSDEAIVIAFLQKIVQTSRPQLIINKNSKTADSQSKKAKS